MNTMGNKDENDVAVENAAVGTSQAAPTITSHRRLEAALEKDVIEAGKILGLELSDQHERNMDMLLFKYLTPEMAAKYKDHKTSHGFTLKGLAAVAYGNPDSSLGVYVGDAETYSMFGEILDPIIRDYHNGYDVSGLHKKDLDLSKIPNEDLDPSGERVISTRIRCGRNLREFAFPAAIKLEDRPKMVEKVTAALGNLQDDLSGKYFPLEGMSEEDRVSLVKDHFLFKQGDRFMETGGVNRDWPVGRGIFHSADKKFLSWVGEEDTMRIISMQKGGKVAEVFDRWARAVTALEKQLDFAFDEHLGYLAGCPSNLGTAMRASVHIKIPKLGADEKKLKEICKGLGLSVRGIHGEHSASEGGVYDISNSARLGLSEVEIAHLMINGVKELLRLEDQQ